MAGFYMPGKEILDSTKAQLFLISWATFN